MFSTLESDDRRAFTVDETLSLGISQASGNDPSLSLVQDDDDDRFCRNPCLLQSTDAFNDCVCEAEVHQRRATFFYSR